MPDWQNSILTGDVRERLRDHKESTGLSWDEYHARHFRHEQDIADLREQTEALAGHVRELRRNIGEVLILAGDSDE